MLDSTGNLLQYIHSYILPCICCNSLNNFCAPSRNHLVLIDLIKFMDHRNCLANHQGWPLALPRFTMSRFFTQPSSLLLVDRNMTGQSCNLSHRNGCTAEHGGHYIELPPKSILLMDSHTTHVHDALVSRIKKSSFD